MRARGRSTGIRYTGRILREKRGFVVSDGSAANGSDRNFDVTRGRERDR